MIYIYEIKMQINIVRSLHAKVMEFYIFTHFTLKCKVMLSYSFEFNLRNSTNVDMEIYRHAFSSAIVVTALLECM